MNRNKQWIFFDLDGTLADSLPAMCRAYQSFLDNFNIKGSDKEFSTLNGPSLPEIVSILKQTHGLAKNRTALENLYRKAQIREYRDHVRPFKEATSVLKQLKKASYHLLLVTSAARKVAHPFVTKHHWGQYFEKFVYGNEVTKAKPHPEIYKLALKKAGISPQQAIVVEDSLHGIKSAKQSGTFVIGVKNDQQQDENLIKAEADIIVPNLRAVGQYLETDWDKSK